VSAWPADVAFIATVYPDWTTLELRDGDVFGFNRETGRVYKLPHDECPLIPFRPAWSPPA
jgi:hypothetical protein